MTEELNASDAKPTLIFAKHMPAWIYMIIGFLALLAILTLSYSGWQIIDLFQKAESEENLKNQMKAPYAYISSVNESINDSDQDRHSNTTKVYIGLYLEHIKDFNIKESKWTADFTIWFYWYGDMNSSLPSPEKYFRIVNGYINKDNIKWIEPKQGYYSDSKRWYYIYEVKNAEIADNFDTRLYPMDDQALAIKIEDLYADINQITYVPDNNSSINDRVNLVGFNITDYIGNVSTDEYRTNWGQPNKNISNKTIASQFNFILYAERDNKVILVLKIFLGLICAVFVAMAALFIKPTWVDPRFGLGVGSLFAAIANNYIVASSLPVAGIVTMSGLIHGIGITIIFFTIAQSILSLYIYDDLGAHSFSRRFDKYTFGFLFSVVILNICLLKLLFFS